MASAAATVARFGTVASFATEAASRPAARLASSFAGATLRVAKSSSCVCRVASCKCTCILTPASCKCSSSRRSIIANAAVTSNGPVAKEAAVRLPPPSKRAAPAALATIAASFPNAMELTSFVHAVAEALFDLGFKRDNCIAIVNTCRDEVCRPLVTLIDGEFGHSFNISGLGGLVNCGKTGLRAAMSHSPEHPCEVDGTLRERYVFFAFPHISIGESGKEGSLLRRGRGKPCGACGALMAVKGALKETPNVSEPYPADDFEFAALKRKVLTKLTGADANTTSLVDVTKATQEVITSDLEDLISKVVDPAVADYAVVTGVQIHSGNQVEGEPFRMDRTVDYIAPASMYAVIRGEKYIMHPEVAQITGFSSLPVKAFVGPS